MDSRFWYLSDNGMVLDRAKAIEVILEDLKNIYIQTVEPTDRRLLQYLKRKNLNILTSEDETDYQTALSDYQKFTLKYREFKSLLMEEINTWHNNDFENYSKDLLQQRWNEFLQQP